MEEPQTEAYSPRKYDKVLKLSIETSIEKANTALGLPKGKAAWIWKTFPKERDTMLEKMVAAEDPGAVKKSKQMAGGKVGREKQLAAAAEAKTAEAKDEAAPEKPAPAKKKAKKKSAAKKTATTPVPAKVPATQAQSAAPSESRTLIVRIQELERTVAELRQIIGR